MKSPTKFELDADGSIIREVDDLALVEFGLRRIYATGGELVDETQFKFGRPHGHSRTWNPDGQLTSHACYRLGKLDGVYRCWWDNGCLKEEGNYLAGKKVGRYVWYKPDGSVWSDAIAET